MAFLVVRGFEVSMSPQKIVLKIITQTGDYTEEDMSLEEAMLALAILNSPNPAYDPNKHVFTSKADLIPEHFIAQPLAYLEIPEEDDQK